jgi:hypothetical protein
VEHFVRDQLRQFPELKVELEQPLSFCLLAFFYLLWTPFDKASDLPVIKDSEATQFVGQNVEVKGLVVAVHTSRKGNTFINFGAPYPNQTFTGWIPPGSAVLDDESEWQNDWHCWANSAV